MEEKTNYGIVDPLNVLRVVAALCVFFLHTTIFTDVSFFAERDATFIFRTPAWAGVWIFMFLSGYFAGKGFISGKYSLSVRGFLQYYKRRFVKIIFPTLCFIFFCVTVIQPDFVPNNPDFLPKVLTFMYRGKPDFSAMGATWYVFLLFWFYLLAPFAAFLLNKCCKTVHILLACVFTVGGFAFRLLALKYKLPWSQDVYLSLYGNADLFFSGMCWSYASKNKKLLKHSLGAVLKICAGVLLAALIIVNCYIYNQGSLGDSALLNVYQYYFPTAYILLLMLYVYVFDNGRGKVVFSAKRLAENPLHIIDRLASISFEFYLLHSLVLWKISGWFTLEDSLSAYLLLALTGAIITIILSVGFHRIFKTKEIKQ